MRVGDSVITPYNQEGTILEMFDETRSCIIEVDGEKATYYQSDLTPTSFQFEEDPMIKTMPLYDIGDKVRINGNDLVCTVHGIIGVEDDMVWYDIDMSGSLICEEESNLRYVSGQYNIRTSNLFLKKDKEYKFAVAIKYESDKWEYKLCDINDIRSFLVNKEYYYCIKTYVFKTGMSFPGTESFTGDDIKCLDNAEKIPPLTVGSHVWNYRRQKWGQITGSTADSYDVLMEDGVSILMDYDEMFIPEQSE